MDVVLLSRIQFALTIMFHYLFPPLTIGMGIVLVYLEAQYLRTKESVYSEAARFWTKIFALNFAVGVASGIVMEFQFGTNWAGYSRFVGDVFGSALAAEGLFAFFLESGFLAVLVFGWDRVSARFHFFATVMVALGSVFSAIWIIVANSWQQTPAGHRIVQMTRDGQPWFIDGSPVMRAEVADFWAMVFNPSTLHRLGHTLIGAVVLGTFFVMSISAYYLLRDRHHEFARRSFTGALWLALIASLAALISGDFNAKMVAHHQPAKLAAFEGHFKTGPADLSIIGWPDAEKQTVAYNLAVPGMLSYLVTERFDGEVIGLDKFRRDEWPPVLLSYLTYHVMVGLGMLLIGLTVLAVVLQWRGTLFHHRWLLWTFVVAVAFPMIANQMGWCAAEVGRQPWVVHPRVVRDDQGRVMYDSSGYVEYRREEGLRTEDGVSEVLTVGRVGGSLVMFGVIYSLLAAVWLFLLNHKIQTGPRSLPVSDGGDDRGFLATAALRPQHRRSLTELSDESGSSEKSDKKRE